MFKLYRFAVHRAQLSYPAQGAMQTRAGLFRPALGDQPGFLVARRASTGADFEDGRGPPVQFGLGPQGGDLLVELVHRARHSPGRKEAAHTEQLLDFPWRGGRLRLSGCYRPHRLAPMLLGQARGDARPLCSVTPCCCPGGGSCAGCSAGAGPATRRGPGAR